MRPSLFSSTNDWSTIRQPPSDMQEKVRIMTPAVCVYLRVSLSIDPDHIFGSRWSDEGPSVFVLLDKRVDGLLQTLWSHGLPLCVCRIYDTPV